MTEVWKEINGFEGNYEVSTEGRVRSLSRRLKSRYGSRLKIGKVLKTAVNGSGYKYVSLSKEGKASSHRVHKLVARTFIPITDVEVNHKDGDKLNNFSTNLEWCSRSQNAIHAYKNNLLVLNPERMSFAKLTWDQVKKMRSLYRSGSSIGELKTHFNMSRKQTSDIVNHKAWFDKNYQAEIEKALKK